MGVIYFGRGDDGLRAAGVTVEILIGTKELREQSQAALMDDVGILRDNMGPTSSGQE